MKAENVFDMPRRLSVADGQPFSKGDDAAKPAILEMPQSPAAIRRSAFLELILRQIPDGVIVSDRQGTIILANPAAKQFALLDPEGQSLDFVQSIWGELLDVNGAHIAAEDWPLMRALRGQYTNGKECRLVNLGGSCSDLVFNACPIHDVSGEIVGAVATLTDIAHQKHAEWQLREEMLEKQRSSMAADIHDTVSQSLTAIVLQLRAVEIEMPKSLEMAQKYLHTAQDVARDSLRETRRSIWTLSHESLQGQDLAQALSLLAEQFFTATSVKVKLSLQQEPHFLSPDARRELIKIGREALANVLKHAKATKVRLVLLYTNREVRLYVDDNGCGFATPGRPHATGGYGLTSMSRRAESLGGKIDVCSYPGRGTRVVARVPLDSRVLRRSA
jgi:signal transduction histidine kinase